MVRTARVEDGESNEDSEGGKDGESAKGGAANKDGNDQARFLLKVCLDLLRYGITMNRTHALFAAGLLALGATVTTHAATRDEETKACRGDAMHFCASDIPNEDKITACMKQHVNELSPACRAMFKPGKKGGDKTAQ